MSDAIPTTSGFILPINQHYTPYDKDGSTVIDFIYNRNSTLGRESELLSYFKENKIHNSSTINKLHTNYNTDPTLDNYMTLVGIVSEILKTVDPVTFFTWQVGNPHITKTSMMFCRDVLLGRFYETYNSYTVIPSTARFVINNGVTTDKTSQLARQMFDGVDVKHISWVSILNPMIEQRPQFLAFFRFIFTDYY